VRINPTYGFSRKGTGIIMKQLGNLVIICAKREDVALTLEKGIVTVFVGSGPDRTHFDARWDDDKKINDISFELNHGRYRLAEAA